ncbi:rpl-27a [Symbiodinium sp. KB8]|nr:rpl-27a [Symbiodinium sp. KB8]
MSLTVEVSLLSGKTISFEASWTDSVESLRLRAQRALGTGKGRLLNSAGAALDGKMSLEGAMLQTAEALTLQIRSVQLCSGSLAMSAILGDGSVVSWGGSGADSTAVREKLKNVHSIQAASMAFAAILDDGSVVCWGDLGRGGDSSSVQDQLKNVQQIQATKGAFAAVLDDGSVVTWGSDFLGGNSSGVRDLLKNVQQIQATGLAFAAILIDGSVVTWGDAASGGDCFAIRDKLKDVRHIQATGTAFAAILGDGSAVSWGDVRFGGDSSSVQDLLKNVKQIQATEGAFAAILENGSVVSWGEASFGGDGNVFRDQLQNVRQIQANTEAFAAILSDGSVVSWGDARCGGGPSCSILRDQLKTVSQIQATESAFAAILEDGSVVSWGDTRCGGDSRAVRDKLRNVQQIQASRAAFAAILRDGSVVSWGDAGLGGDSSGVRDELKTVQQIQATESAFAAILADGSVVSWGSAFAGGDSSAVRNQLQSSSQVTPADRCRELLRNFHQRKALGLLPGRVNCPVRTLGTATLPSHRRGPFGAESTGMFVGRKLNLRVQKFWRFDSYGMAVAEDKYHPGYFGKVGMRNFHLIKHGKAWGKHVDVQGNFVDVIPIINVERLWSLVSEQTRTYYKEHTDKAPVIDVMKAGYMKVCGKGQLPEQPLIVKARYFTKEAETKIKEATLHEAVRLQAVLQDEDFPKRAIPGTMEGEKGEKGEKGAGKGYGKGYWGGWGYPPMMMMPWFGKGKGKGLRGEICRLYKCAEPDLLLIRKVWIGGLPEGERDVEKNKSEGLTFPVSERAQKLKEHMAQAGECIFAEINRNGVGGAAFKNPEVEGSHGGGRVPVARVGKLGVATPQLQDVQKAVAMLNGSADAAVHE